MHLPEPFVTELALGQFCGGLSGFGFFMERQGIVLEYQTDLFGVFLENRFNLGIFPYAVGALKVAELHNRYRGLRVSQHR